MTSSLKQIQKRQKTSAWTHVQTRHALCTCGSTYMRESNERALGTKRNVSTHFVSISRMLYFVYLNIWFHWLSLTLKPYSINISPSSSIKNQGLSRTKIIIAASIELKSLAVTKSSDTVYNAYDYLLKSGPVSLKCPLTGPYKQRKSLDGKPSAYENVRLQTWVNEEFVWEFQRDFVKAVVNKAVRWREWLLRQLPL